jgi:hypothetical protein
MSQKISILISRERYNAEFEIGSKTCWLGLYKWGGISKDRGHAPMPTSTPARPALLFAIFVSALLVAR